MSTATDIYSTSIHCLFSQLYESDITVSPIENGPSPDSHFACATYTNKSGEVSKCILFDCALANYAGAALTMFPIGRAQDAIDANTIPDSVQMNLDEVVNIAVNILHDTTHQHLVLERSFLIQEGEQSLEFSNAHSYDVDIMRYGKGVLTIADVKTS